MATPTLAGQLLAWLLANKKRLKLSALADEAGVDNGTLSRWLRGVIKTPQAATLAKLVAAAEKEGFIAT